MTNKYPAKCINCKAPGAAGAGILKRSKRGRYYVLHPNCERDQGTRVHTYRFSSSDKVYTRNAAGRCIDAPCCGCCTI